MDFATIKGAYDGLAFAKTALELVVDKKADAKAREKVDAALGRLGEVQDVLYKLRDELGELQDANRSLKDKLATFEQWADKTRAYSLQKTAGGAIVYHADGPPSHYACPVCYEQRELQILQDRRVYSGLYECPRCKASFPINPHTPGPQRRVISHGIGR